MVTRYPMTDEYELREMGIMPGRRIYYLVFKDDKLIHNAKMGTIDSWAHSHSLTYPEELPVPLQQEFIEQYAKEVGNYESIADAIFHDGSLYLIVMTRNPGEWKSHYDWLKKQAVRDKYDELVEQCNREIFKTLINELNEIHKEKNKDTIQIDLDTLEPEEIIELLNSPKPKIARIDVNINVEDE